MRYTYVILLCAGFIFAACGGSKKAVIAPDEQNQPFVLSEAETTPEKTAEEPIIEVEEKLVSVNELPPDPARYFVIIGSFRNPDNAKYYQKQIHLDGFSSELLKNEEGLYRVSVMTFDDILKARKEIKRIRETFPKYSDTWLLIQVQ